MIIYFRGGEMKKVLKLIIFILTCVIVTGCGSNNITKITYSELEKKLENKESFILEIVQDGCHNCESFSPKFEKVLNEYNIQAFSINLSNITEEENEKLNNLYNITGTPAVIFIEKGDEPSILRRIVGDSEEDKIISKLKTAGYIKE